MHTSVILNPNAGTAISIPDLHAALDPLGDVQIQPITAANSAEQLAHQALDAGAELVVAAGGDGTINGVVNGLAKQFAQAQLGVIPLGTGNDFARSINVPTDLQAAVEVLSNGQSQAIDVVRVRSDRVCYSINVSAAGFSGLVDEKLTDTLKQSWGPLAYLRSAIGALPDLSSYQTWISFDDQAPVETSTYNLVIANARYVAGGIPIAPEAQLDDGLVDVVLVPAASLPQLAVLVPQILLGRHLESPLVTFRRARTVSIHSYPGMWFNVDGELVGNEPATFEVLPRALRVITGSAITNG